jgi:hypothetical protein
MTVTEHPLTWQAMRASYKAPSGEHLHPSRFTSEGRPVYTYLRTPSAKDPFLTLTLAYNRQQPNVEWNGKGLIIHADQPIVEADTKVPLTLGLPNIRGEMTSFAIESGRFSVRNTREGLAPHIFLAPEVEEGRYLYHSPEGTSLSFVLDDPKQSSPVVMWRDLPGSSQGEFFVVPGRGQELSNIYSSSRTTVELPQEGREDEVEKAGAQVSVDNGLFHVRNGNHGVAYVAFDGNVERVEAHGESLGREAHMLISEGNFIKDLYLRGHTYVQTHDARISPYSTMPPKEFNAIGTIHVGNGKALEFNNDRINGYELGLVYNPDNRTYGVAHYSLEELRERELRGLDRYRSGHFINLPLRARKSDKPPSEQRKLEKKADDSESPPRGRVAVLETVDLRGDYIWKHILANFEAAGIHEPNKDDIKLAQILTYIANGTDQTPPRGLTTRMLTPDALKVLVERNRHPKLDQLVTDILDNAEPHVKVYKHVSDMARMHAERGQEVISLVNGIANAHMPPEDPAVLQLRNQIERRFSSTPRPIPLFSARERRRWEREERDQETTQNIPGLIPESNELPRTTIGDVAKTIWRDVRRDVKKFREKRKTT